MKRFLAALLALCLFPLAGCGKPDTPGNDEPAPPSSTQPAATNDMPEPPPVNDPEPPRETEPSILEADGLEVPIPKEYLDLLVIETDLEAWSEHLTPLISLSEKASLEAFAADYPDSDGESSGMGWLCSIIRLDRIGFEKWISEDTTGSCPFAKDDSEHYYLISEPTDVTLYRRGMGDGGPIGDAGSWGALNTWAEERLPGDIIAHNGLTAYDASDLFGVDYTYAGEHVELGYRSSDPNDPMDLVILSLSQPAKQGEGGIWCVERVRDIYSAYSFTDTHLVFPAALGFNETAADYYAQVQAECDAGEHPELLTPMGAALDYAKRETLLFGEDVSATDFEMIESLG